MQVKLESTSPPILLRASHSLWIPALLTDKILQNCWFGSRELNQTTPVAFISSIYFITVREMSDIGGTKANGARILGPLTL